MKKSAAILSMKCPRCNEGNLYSDNNPLHLRRLHLMPERCGTCGLAFTPEPGFYTGAMYVSYGFSVALFITYFFVLVIALKADALVFLLAYGASLIVLSPFLFRYSRVVFLHLFYNYEPRAKEQYLKSLTLDVK